MQGWCAACAWGGVAFPVQRARQVALGRKMTVAQALRDNPKGPVMRVIVECYSGFKADQRPVRFCLNGHWYEVVEVCDQWYSPGSTYFKVRAGNNDLYILQRSEGQDEWTLEAFRAAHRQ
jgi:hypothetical protein